MEFLVSRLLWYLFCGLESKGPMYMLMVKIYIGGHSTGRNVFIVWLWYMYNMSICINRYTIDLLFNGGLRLRIEISFSKS